MIKNGELVVLKDTIIEADKLFNKFDLTTVVVYPSEDKHCCISCHTNDDLVWVFAKNNNYGYELNQFSFRTWSSIHSVISTFPNETLKIESEFDSSNYPQMLKVSSGRMKMNYFLQNFNLISNQPELLAEYEGKRINLNRLKEGNAEELDENIIKDIVRLSSLVNEKYFRIGRDSENYIYFGDENQSIDNGKIYIGDIGGENIWSSDMYFSVEYFASMFRALVNQNIKVRITPKQIIMLGEENNVTKICVLRGKSL